MARSRGDARARIIGGSVLVGGLPATKPDRRVSADESIVVADPPSRRRVSRGGDKLADALVDLGGPAIEGRLALDAGASTGGFTQVLLEHGARHVIAVDVGHGQLAWELRIDPRVTVMDRTNVRLLRPADLPYRPDLIVADLSFISLRTALGPLSEVADPEADWLALVKPQFEVGRANIGRRGVVTDQALRRSAVAAVADAAASLGLGCRGVVASRHPGPAGNVEYFLWLRAHVGPLGDDELARALAAGPADRQPTSGGRGTDDTSR